MGGGREMDMSKSTGNSRADRNNATANGDVTRRMPETDEVELPVPPDGGWGWVVVAASFIIHVIADGIVYSFGIFYMEFLDYYKGGKGETAWVGSLVPGVTLTVGPLASILTNKYGCRVTTIIGSIIAASGFLLSLMAPNLYFLYFSFGIMSGLGFGLIYLPAIVSVGYYFENRRAFAMGLAVCGSGFGAFMFNPLAKYLIDEYGWRGAILIEAGIILNCIICGAMFRPLDVKSKKRKPSTKRRTRAELQELLKDNVEMEILITSDKCNLATANHRSENGHVCDDAIPGIHVITSEPSSPRHSSSEFHAIDPARPEPMSLFNSEGALHNRHWNHSALAVSPKASSGNRPRVMQRLISEEFPHSRQHHQLTPGGIYQSGSLLNINLHRSHPALYITSISSLPDQSSDVKKTVCGCLSIPENLFYSLKHMCDFSLLKDVIFLMFVISNFCTSIGFNMPFIFLTDRAVVDGINEDDAKWLVSAIGISNTVGRVVFGYTSDFKGVNRLLLYNTALTICGVATALSPFCRTYTMLVLYACVFGLFIGVYVSLTSIVLVDLLGLEMLTNSFGLLLMFQGFATLVGPPIAGWLYDATGSYEVSFQVAGVMIAVSGIMLYFIPCVKMLLGRQTNGVEIEHVIDEPEPER